MEYLIFLLLAIWLLVGVYIGYKSIMQWIVNKDIEYNGEEAFNEWEETMNLKEQSNVLTTYYNNLKMMNKINEIYKTIDEAVHNGEYEIFIEGELSKTVIKHLKNDGFKVKHHKHYFDDAPFYCEYYIIDWR